MALKGTLSKESSINPYRVDFEDAYFKIDGASINVINNEIKIRVRAYANEYARHNYGMGVFKKTVKLNLEDLKDVPCNKDDILTALYLKLKDQDEFKELSDHKKKFKGKIDHTNPDAPDDHDNIIDDLTDVENTLENL